MKKYDKQIYSVRVVVLPIKLIHVDFFAKENIQKCKNTEKAHKSWKNHTTDEKNLLPSPSGHNNAANEHTHLFCQVIRSSRVERSKRQNFGWMLCVG